MITITPLYRDLSSRTISPRRIQSASLSTTHSLSTTPSLSRSSHCLCVSLSILDDSASLSCDLSSTKPVDDLSSTESVGASLDDYSSLWLSSTPPHLALYPRRLCLSLVISPRICFYFSTTPRVFLYGPSLSSMKSNRKVNRNQIWILLSYFDLFVVFVSASSFYLISLNRTLLCLFMSRD